MKEIVLKYDKDVAMKTGAFSYKLYVFMLWIAVVILLISSSIFEFICYRNGLSIPVITRFTSKIIYLSLFLILVWLFAIPIWYPAHIAENLVFVKKNKKLYKIRNKKDNIFDRNKYLEDTEFLNEVIKNLPRGNENIILEEYDNISIKKRTKKYIVLEADKINEGKMKKIKIYNIYDNFDKFSI